MRAMVKLIHDNLINSSTQFYKYSNISEFEVWLVGSCGESRLNRESPNYTNMILEVPN